METTFEFREGKIPQTICFTETILRKRKKDF